VWLWHVQAALHVKVNPDVGFTVAREVEEGAYMASFMESLEGTRGMEAQSVESPGEVRPLE